MHRSRTASLMLVILCAAVVPALAGVIAGGIAKPDPAPPRGALASSPTLSLFAPPGWVRARAVPIPGLQLRDTIALEPLAASGQAGVVAGRYTNRGASPLPRSLLNAVQGPLRTEIVGVESWDGYRYKNLRLAGFDRSLILYTVPTATGGFAVACWAKPAGVRRLPACERIARSLAIQSNGYGGLQELSRGYARAVGRVMDRLNARRVDQRRSLRGDVEPAQAAAATLSLAGAYETAARDLTAARPPEAAGGAHSVLIRKLWSAHDAYQALADTARAQDTAGWSTESGVVNRSEDEVSQALHDLGALGYGRQA